MRTDFSFKLTYDFNVSISETSPLVSQDAGRIRNTKGLSDVMFLLLLMFLSVIYRDTDCVGLNQYLGFISIARLSIDIFLGAIVRDFMIVSK